MLARLRRRSVAAATCLALAAGGAAGCSSDGDPGRTLNDFMVGWTSGNLDHVAFVAPTGEKVAAATVRDQIKALSGQLVAKAPALKASGKPKVSDKLATGSIAVDWTLPAGGHWTYATPIELSKADQGWRVIWSPKVLHPQLTTGDELGVRRVTANRASILDAAGNPIVAPRPVVVVGVQPGEVTDPAALVKALDAAFKSVNVAVDLTGLPAQLKAAKPESFVEVVTLREPAYLQIKSRIYDLPGTKFRAATRDLAPTREFARALLGTVDDVLKEDMDANPGKFVVGDRIGHGGLQGRYDERLRGQPGESVVIVRKDPEGKTADTEIFKAEPKPGTPLKTTLDPKVQNAADTALRGVPQRSSLVALRVSDGAVLAVANGPDGGGPNLAFTAQVPPGSTFKMVSALGLLDAGAVSLNGVVPCPQKFVVEGRTFTNSNMFALGNVPFRVDFAKSCNTAFASLAPKLGPDGLAKAGAALGLGGGWDIGVEAFTGKVSTGGAGSERAAAAFGQGTTLVSPLAMASATAAVARGGWQQPKLLIDPAPATTAPGPPLAPGSVEPLRTMMREVVTAGTGNAALGKTPGGPVFGKTGTAEYDNNPAHTHAWFIGWQGDIAFAVFIEQGGAGSTNAAPIADKFLRGLAA